MKYLFLIGLIFPFWANAQQYPSDVKVIEAVKKYHGKIATAKVQNEWKQEREAGYTFNNMAKRVVAATTIKEAGHAARNITGLAIYTRSSTTDTWHFSRFFVTSGEVTGLKDPTESDLKEQLLDLLRKEPIKVFVQYNEVAWVYDITFPDGVKYTTDRTGDRIYSATIEYEFKFISAYPFEGGIRRYKNPLEVYVRETNGQLKVATAVIVNKDPVKEILMTEKQYNTLPVLGQKTIDELYGPQGPEVSQHTNAPSKTLKLPKVKSVLKG